MTEDKVKNLLVAAQSVEDQVKLAKDFCKQWARRNGGIRHEGKVYKEIMQKGRERVMGVAKVREILGKKADKVIVRGGKIPAYRWVNDN
jgi:hypothetical protein